MVKRLDTIVEVDDGAIAEDLDGAIEDEKLKAYANLRREASYFGFGLPATNIIDISEPEWEPDVGRNSVACLVLEHDSPQPFSEEVRRLASAIAKPKDSVGRTSSTYDETCVLGSDIAKKPLKSGRRKRRESLIDKAARQQEEKCYLQEQTPAAQCLVVAEDISRGYNCRPLSEFAGVFQENILTLGCASSTVEMKSPCYWQSSNRSGEKRYRRRESLIDKADRMQRKQLQQEQVYLDMAANVFEDGTDDQLIRREFITLSL
jgi:hypothetical protein